VLIPALQHEARQGHRHAWRAAERLGLCAGRQRDYSRAAAWTRRATELSPPQRVRATLERRLSRYVAKCQ
jgi:hypothetical protein